MTDRGKEAREDVRKRRVCKFATRTSSHQDPPGDEQKSHLRPTTPGECASQHEAELEDGALVDVALGRGQITLLSGEICERTRE